MRYDDRRIALVASLSDAEVDVAVISAPVDVRYLTGFTGSNGAVLVPRDGEAVLATDGRYMDQAAAEVDGVRIVETRTPALTLVAGVPAGTAIGLDSGHVTLARFEALRAVLADSTRLVPMPNPVMPLRMIKDDDEVAALSAACEATDAAFAHVVEHVLRPAVTELEVAWAIEAAMRAAGAEGTAFESIVAFGPNSAIPHHQPTDRPLERGDLVKIDIGALVEGYHADMTRTVVMGEPAQWQREFHAMVLDVQQQCMAATAPGVAAADLQNLANDLVAATGNRLPHGLGHGVGLEIHEDPFLTPEATTLLLAEHMTITIEPGIYLPGRGGVRIEDTLVLSRHASRPITGSVRALLEI